MPTWLRFIASLTLALLLAGLAGCASAPSAPSPEPVPEPAPEPAALPSPETFLATLTLDAESAPLYAEPSTASLVIATLRAGAQLSLIERTTAWLKVKTASGVIGFIEPSALVASTCTQDRAEPTVLEVPVFAFNQYGPHGNIVIEAELDANARILNTRVLENGTGNPALEQQAIADLYQVRFLPPTKGCKPQRFFYTFTRQF